MKISAESLSDKLRPYVGGRLSFELLRCKDYWADYRGTLIAIDDSGSISALEATLIIDIEGADLDDFRRDYDVDANGHVHVREEWIDEIEVLGAAGTVTCPSCDHVIPAADVQRQLG